MNFKEALNAMKEGHKVKRKNWNGFWMLVDGELLVDSGDHNIKNIRFIESIIPVLKSAVCNDWEIVE